MYRIIQSPNVVALLFETGTGWPDRYFVPARQRV
jgi:hypothetical protein